MDIILSVVLQFVFTEMNYLDLIPNETLRDITFFLELEDLMTLRLVCKRLHLLLHKGNDIWKNKCLEFWKSVDSLITLTTIQICSDKFWFSKCIVEKRVYDDDYYKVFIGSCIYGIAIDTVKYCIDIGCFRGAGTKLIGPDKRASTSICVLIVKIRSIITILGRMLESLRMETFMEKEHLQEVME
jgi:hypothetical protein